MNRQKTILIAEVDQIIARQIKKYFESLGYYVYPVVSTGEELLAEAKDLKPSLIIIDTKLNGHIDGVEAIYRLGQESNIPYIFITSSDEDVGLIKSYFLQPLFLIQRPISLINLDVSFNNLNLEMEPS